MNIERVSSELYQRLFVRRYPGVAQTTSKDVQETVLASENRLFLLSWLLAQTSSVDSQEFLNNPDESKVVQWYSEMGICNEPEVLMGRVPIADQIVALRNLLLFIKSVVHTEQPCETSEEPGDIIDLYKKYDEDSNAMLSNVRLTHKLTYNEALRYLDECRDSLKEKNACSEEPTNDLSLDEFHVSPRSPENSNDSEWKERVLKFMESFETATTWPKSASTDSTTMPYKSMDSCIESIHRSMATLKETIQTKHEISNAATLEPLEYCQMPLDRTIEDIVIGIEELSRWQNSG